jgi:hypothetical protein
MQNYVEPISQRTPANNGNYRRTDQLGHTGEQQQQQQQQRNPSQRADQDRPNYTLLILFNLHNF